jgi:N-acyl-D-aspartate/D-glutamate deacylase
MFDLVIRKGTVIDGSGRPGFVADVAVKNGVIEALGKSLELGRREINAEGLLVTPGWIDPHTHYDGQAPWDSYLSPSCWHGVTTVVMGNCGVAFAPVKKQDHDRLIGVMQGVEDIPGIALSEGLKWGWETFPEYLDVLNTMPRAINVATILPHAPLRVYVMGDRGVRNEPATDDDIVAMSKMVKEALAAGAVGFSTSRTTRHRSVDGEIIPGTVADYKELEAIAGQIEEQGGGYFGLIAADITSSDLASEEEAAAEMEWMTRVSKRAGVKVSMLFTQQGRQADLRSDFLLQKVAEARTEGGDSFCRYHPGPPE